MRTSFAIVAVLFSVSAFQMRALADGEGEYCGDAGLQCTDEERCCEHTVAMFTPSGATAPAYTEGRCVSRGTKCSDYWCGNRHCENGIFGMPNVCCVTQKAGSPNEYKCAYSEYSCPGNPQPMTIRQSRAPDPSPDRLAKY